MVAGGRQAELVFCDMDPLRMDWPSFRQKMVERSLWALWWFFLGGAGVWLLVGSVAYWVKRGWLPPDASGWAQAIGSLAAVAVAIALPLRMRFVEIKRQASERRSAEMGLYFQLSKIIDMAKSFTVELKDSREGALYHAISMLVFGLLEDVQEQLSVLHAAGSDRLLMKLIVSTKIAIAKFCVCIIPDDISSSTDLNTLLGSLNAIQDDLNGYISREELITPQQIGVTG